MCSQNNKMELINTLETKLNNRELVISVIGLGYVGLPLAVEFGKLFPTIGFDINENRIKELNQYKDRTLEVTEDQLKSSNRLELTSSVENLAKSDVFIVTVPTPIDGNKTPDLRPVISATEMIGKILTSGKIIIYESTVFPGCTEEVCVPLLEKESKLTFNTGFFCGYSPERINPGDKEHTVTKIKKITSGSTSESAKLLMIYTNPLLLQGLIKPLRLKLPKPQK